MKVKQQKITSTWKLLPEHEKKKFLLEEETKRRMELREAKVNLWKKWRHPNNHKKTEKNKNVQPGDRLLDRLEQNLERMRNEVTRRNAALAQAEERRTQLIAERKIKQEQLLRQEQEKQDKKVKKKMLEERWEMMKWLTRYIDENTDKWAIQKKEKEENEKKWLQDWARMTRLEKIQTIRDKQPNQQTLNVRLLPEKFKQPENPTKPTATPNQSNLSQADREIPSVPLPSLARTLQKQEYSPPDNTPQQAQEGEALSVAQQVEVDQLEGEDDTSQPSHHDDLPEPEDDHHDHPEPEEDRPDQLETQPGDMNTHKIRQSPTIPGAVGRYVGVLIVNNLEPVLIKYNLGEVLEDNARLPLHHPHPGRHEDHHPGPDDVKPQLDDDQHDHPEPGEDQHETQPGDNNTQK